MLCAVLLDIDSHFNTEKAKTLTTQSEPYSSRSQVKIDPQGVLRQRALLASTERSQRQVRMFVNIDSNI